MSGSADPLSVALGPEAVTLRWHDGESSLGAAVLRANCRCAPCLSARLRGEAVEIDISVTLVDAQPIGHYAVQLRFSDGHERGIYPWAYLRELSDERASSVPAPHPADDDRTPFAVALDDRPSST